jgi:hypothetical protein
MGELIGFIIEVVLESVFSLGGHGEVSFITESIGCLGGSVLYAMTGGRLDLENNDGRAMLLGWVIVFIVLGVAIGGLVLIF